MTERIFSFTGDTVADAAVWLSSEVERLKIAGERITRTERG